MLKALTANHWLSSLASAFFLGALAYLEAAFQSGHWPATIPGLEAIALGAVSGGGIAVLHVLQGVKVGVALGLPPVPDAPVTGPQTPNAIKAGLPPLPLLIICLAMFGCFTPAQDATVARVDGAIIPWTKTTCEVASDAPVPAGWVDLSCTVLEGVELGVKEATAGAGSSLPPSLTAAAAPPPASTAAAPSPPPIPLAPSANKPATLRLRVPLAAARALAAAHPQTLSLPSKL